MNNKLFLPKKILSLDIETDSVLVNGFRHCFLVGWIEYAYQPQKGYIANQYQWMGENEIAKKLPSILDHFDGLIIGHNVLSFDYNVLQQYCDMNKYRPKTCDTYKLLGSLTKNKKGLSLNNLAQLNWGECKQQIAGDVSRMWQVGKKLDVLHYNAKDCDLNMHLWTYLIEHQKIRVFPNSADLKLSFWSMKELLSGNGESPKDVKI